METVSANSVTISTDPIYYSDSDDDDCYYRKELEEDYDENDYYGPWKSFIVTATSDDKSRTYENGSNLLQTPKKSILGDIQINVGADKYILDKVTLASKSYYFEKLFTQKCDLGNNEEITIEAIKSDVFSILVEIIYGNNFKSAINANNFVDILKGMAFLRIEIDLKLFEDLMNDEIVKMKTQFCNQMFQMYYLISSYTNYKYFNFDYLLPTVAKYFSDHLLEIFERREFLSLSYVGFLRVLEKQTDQFKEKGLIGRICATWICQDFENRVTYLVALVNAVKYRYGVFRYCVYDHPNIQSLNKSDPCARIQNVEECFNDLLLYDGEVQFDSSNPRVQPTFRKVNRIDQPTRWMAFLRSGYLYDVAISVQGTVFKLHRIKLLAASEHFKNLFTKLDDSLAHKTDDKSNSILRQYSFDQIDPRTFKSIVRYIYKGEITITSETQMISLLKGSKLLKIDKLYERCYSSTMRITRIFTTHIFEIFQYVCENEKHTDLHTELIKRIINLLPNLSKNEKFKQIPFKILKEILFIPTLQINDADEILDLCSEWIFYDIENRYQYVIETAKAINRNFCMKKEQFKLRIPSTSTDYSSQYVKEQLMRILSSAALVPSNVDCILNDEQKPRFILTKRNGTLLSLVNVNFEEIVAISPKTLRIPLAEEINAIGEPSATIIDDKLFLLFNIDEKFYFQVYHPISNKFISLATDVKMNSSHHNYVILNCNDEIYFCRGSTILKYSILLNRWICFRDDESPSYKIWYTSDGEKLYKMSINKATDHSTPCMFSNNAGFYDFEQNNWIALPKVPILASLTGNDFLWDNLPIKVNIISNDLSILFESKTLLFNWVSQTWSSIDNLNYFVDFTTHGSKILYVSEDKEIHSLSPFHKKWTLVQKLNDCDKIVAIHSVNSK